MKFVKCTRDEVDSKYPMEMEALDNLKLPERGSANSAGYDFYTPYDISIPPHKKTGLFPLWVKAVDMPSDSVLLLTVRSSMGIKKGIRLANTMGVIDSDFNRCIMCDLENTSDETQVILQQERILQGIFVKYLTCDEDNAAGKERVGGIGSTGK